MTMTWIGLMGDGDRTAWVRWLLYEYPTPTMRRKPSQGPDLFMVA